MHKIEKFAASISELDKLLQYTSIFHALLKTVYQVEFVGAQTKKCKISIQNIIAFGNAT